MRNQSKLKGIKNTFKVMFAIGKVEASFAVLLNINLSLNVINKQVAPCDLRAIKQQSGHLCKQAW